MVMQHKNHTGSKPMNMQEMHGPSNHSMHTGMFKRRFFVCLAFTIPVLLLSETIQTWLHFSITIPYQAYILLTLATIIYIYGGLPFLKGLTEELRKLQPGMMTLIGTAISVAFFFSAATVFVPVGNDFFWELATLIDVMLLGHWIEARSVLGASKTLEELVKIMPTMAHAVKNGEIIDVPISELKSGNVVLIHPGEKIPSDGAVVEGESFVNEALLTGESNLVHKEAKDKVIGGAINGDGVLRTRIRKRGKKRIYLKS